MLSLARRATCLGASALLLGDVCGVGRRSRAVAEVHTTSTAPADAAAPAPGAAPALQEGTHFAVLSGADGSPSRLGAVAAAMLRADVVLLGEFHDDAVAHALQLALLKHVAARLGHTSSSSSSSSSPTQTPAAAAAAAQEEQQPSSPIRPLILSLEMFETDVQEVLSEYLAGLIPASDLMRDARPWSNYADYRPMVEFCRAQQLPVLAANAPRRYVSLAGRQGSEALLRLPAAARQWLPPLPHAPSSAPYVAKVQRSMRHAAAGMDALKQQREQQQQEQQAPAADPGTLPVADAAGADSKEGCPYIGLTVSSNFLAAQSLWDATMAWTIAGALQRHQQQQPDTAAPPQQQPQPQPQQHAAVSGPAASAELPRGPLVVHVCGKFHCEDRLGIPEHLAAYAPDAKVLVVVFDPHDSMAVSAEQARASGLVGSADFVVLTDGKLPRSFVVEHPV